MTLLRNYDIGNNELVLLINQLKTIFVFLFFRISRELIGRPLLALLKIKLMCKKQTSLFPKHLSCLQTCGVVAIEDFLSVQHCAAVVKEIDNCINSESPKLLFRDDIRLFNAESEIPSIVPFYHNAELRKIGCAYLGTPIKNSGCLINLVPANQSTFGSGGSWHRDAIFPQFKALIYLTDVCGENDGAFSYIPRSNRLTYFIKEIFWSNRSPLNSRWSESEIKATHFNLPVSIIGRAGTLILFDTCLLHRGNPNTSLHNDARYAATNYYRSNIGKIESY